MDAHHDQNTQGTKPKITPPHGDAAYPQKERSLSPAEPLKSCAVDQWLRDGYEYIDLLATNVLSAYSRNLNWQEVVEVHKERYRPLVIRAARVASEILSSIDQGRMESISDPSQKVKFFDETVRPVMRTLCDLLRECAEVIPELEKESLRLSLNRGDKGHRFEEFEIEKIATDAASESRERIESIGRLVRALALVQTKATDSADLASAALYALASTPDATFRGERLPPQPAHVATTPVLLDSTLVALMAEVNRIATDLRESLRRRIPDVTVFDFDNLRDKESYEGRLTILILRGELMVVEVEPEGICKLAVPVVNEDFTSLEILKDAFNVLKKRYEGALNGLGAQITTYSRGCPGIEGLAEFVMQLQFNRSENENESRITAAEFRSKQAKAEYLVSVGKVSSLQRRMPGGREYSIGATDELLAVEGCLQDRSVLEQIDRIVKACPGLDTVTFYTEQASELNQEQQDRNEDTTEESDHAAERNRIVAVRFMAARVAQDIAGGLQRKSAIYSQRQLEAVGSLGLKVAGVIVDPDTDVPPVMNMSVRESLLKDVDLVNVLEQILARCYFGTVDLNVENVEAWDILQATRRAVDSYFAETGTTERLGVQLQEREFESAVSGVESFTGVALQILNEQGKIIADGPYSHIEGKFQLRFVPAAILEDLSSKIAASLEEVARRDGVIRIVPFGVALEQRGYSLADAILADVQDHFSALARRACPDDLPSQVESFLRLSLLERDVRPPQFNPVSKVWEIFEEADLPPEERRVVGY